MCGWAAGFAEYERIVALETAPKKGSGGKLTQTDRDKLAIAINTHRLALWPLIGESATRLHHNGKGRRVTSNTGSRSERGCRSFMICGRLSAPRNSAT